MFSNLFRRRDVSGWAKAFWVIFLLVLPYLGVLIYLITQGTGMTERSIQQVQHARDEKKSGSITDKNSRSFVPSWFSRQTAIGWRRRVGRSQRGGATRLEL